MEEVWNKFKNQELYHFQSEYHYVQDDTYNYKTNIKNLWAVLNGFRSNLDTLAEFIEDQIETRQIDDHYVCFDYFDQIDS